MLPTEADFMRLIVDPLPWSGFVRRAAGAVSAAGMAHVARHAAIDALA